MPDPSDHVTTDPDALIGASTSYAEAYPRAAAVAGPPKKPHSTTSVLIIAGLVAALVLGAGLVGYGVYQIRGAGQRKAAEQASKEKAAAKVAAQQLLQKKLAAQAVQTKASEEASRQAAIPQARLASAHITQLNRARADLTRTLDSLKKKANSSSSALSTWNKTWASRQSSYASRRATVASHNASERRRYLGSKVEVSRGGKLVVVYSYHPRYLGAPSRPGKPGPLKASVDSEKKTLEALHTQLASLRSALASETLQASALGTVYQALSSTAKTLDSTVNDARRVAGSAVVSKGSAGHIVDGSKISTVRVAALDGPFTQMGTALNDALTAMGLTPATLSSDSTGTP